MIRDRVGDYFLNGGCNCAEALLCAANDEYGLNLPPEACRVIGGFGGGMGCGRTCGALCGGLGALGAAKCLKGHAHATEGFTELCAAYTESFVKKFGTDSCEELKKQWRLEDVRCLHLIEEAADLLDALLDSQPSVK